MKKQNVLAIFLSACLLFTACAPAVQSADDTVPPYTQENLITKEVPEGTVKIDLSDESIKVNGEEISSDATASVYTANDIVFYEEGKDFTYGEGTEKDEHSQAEADKHTVVHITEPGAYVLSGKLSAGQIAVDLGEDAKDDPNAVVTLVLYGVDITCTVAPAVIFYNVYECGEADEETAKMEVDTSAAGANVIIADGSTNNIRGSYVARIYKSVELNEDKTEVVDSKKLHKYDGAFYSKMSMNVYGEKESTGVLNIYAENEGLDTELHLKVYSGNIHIESGNDGINTNEDNVSVTHILGGTLNILTTGSTGEGDGIDSNGWLIVDGGVVTAAGCGISGDAGIDADKGVYIRGGQVIASANMLDHVQGDQIHLVLTFAQKQKGGTAYTLKNADGNIVLTCTPANDFQYLILSSPVITEGEYTLWQGETQLSAAKGGGQMGGGMGDPGMGRPEGERPEMPEGEMPEGNPPAKPEGELPSMPDGQFPPRPVDSRPDGEQHPGGDMGRPGMGQGGTAEASRTLVVTAGGNYYQIIAM